MALFHRGERVRGGRGEKSLWVECPYCGQISFRKEVERHLWACPECDYHHPVSVEQRIQIIADPGSFEPLFLDITSADPLNFKDQKRYGQRLQEAKRDSPWGEAMVCGRATVEGMEVLLAIQDFSFLGGSMGSAVGERVCRVAEEAVESSRPLIIFPASGGARMQEGLLSLMQMARVSVALASLKERSIPVISVLTDPTTGGVAASFAMQADVILAEPRARVGFAGPRVIEQTVGQKLPEGFQRAEYLLEHGLVDGIVKRPLMKSTLRSILGLLMDPVDSHGDGSR